MTGNASTPGGYPEAIVAHVAETLLHRLRPQSRPWLVGLSGLQGSGKSTFAAQFAANLTERGVAALTMSLDDFYFGRRQRKHLAFSVHPLLATRGVPGTHDLALLERTLQSLQRASAAQSARVPRFDKGLDTRLPPARWRRIAQRPQLIVFEGWCVGVPAQTRAQLIRPLNTLERNADRDRNWREYVNAQLADGYARLWQRFDGLMLLQAPNFGVVQHWRNEQEMALRRVHAPRAMSPAALRRFIMYYERLSRHALRTLPSRADLRIVLDRNRRVRRIVACDGMKCRSSPG